MVQEQWLQLKMKFLLDDNMKIVIQWGEINLWLMGIKIVCVCVCMCVCVEGGISKLSASGATSPISQ